MRLSSVPGGGGGAPVAPPLSYPDIVGQPVLDVPACILKVGRVDVLVLSNFVLGRLAGGHQHFFEAAAAATGVGGEVAWVCVCVLLCVWVRNAEG